MEDNTETSVLKHPATQELNHSVTKLLGAVSRFLDTYKLSEVDHLDVVEIAKLQFKVNQELLAIKDVEKSLGKYHDIIRKSKLPDKLAEKDLRSLAIEGVGRVSLVHDAYASIKGSQQEPALEWLDDLGHGALIKRTVHAASLKALMKSKLKEGEEIPDELFNVTPYTYTKITRETK